MRPIISQTFGMAADGFPPSFAHPASAKHTHKNSAITLKQHVLFFNAASFVMMHSPLVKRNLSGCARKDVLPCKMMRAVAHDVFSPRENMMYSGDAGIFRGLRPAIIKWVRAKPARNVLQSKTHHFLRSRNHHVPKEYIMRRRRASLRNLSGCARQ